MELGKCGALTSLRKNLEIGDPVLLGCIFELIAKPFLIVAIDSYKMITLKDVLNCPPSVQLLTVKKDYKHLSVQHALLI